MLVLQRKQGQRVVIPSLGVSVMITRIQGHNVWLGFDGPDEVRILREELIASNHHSATNNDFEQ